MVWVCALAVAAAARADDGNIRPYILGDRAAGMGGAFTALADDGAGAYYNPGGLAFARRSSLSLSGSVYGVISQTTTDALGPGHDFTATDFNAFPVSTGAVRKFGEVDPATGTARNTLALTVLVPDAVQSDDRDHLSLNQSAFFGQQSRETLWVGATYARRIGSVGIGFSLFGLWGTETDFLDVSGVNNANNAVFGIITGRVDQSLYGAVAAFGARWDSSASTHLGLSIFSPEVGWGSRRSFVRVAVSNPPTTNPQAAIVTQDNLPAWPTLPLRAQLGFAVDVSSRFTLSADVQLVGPEAVTVSGGENVVRNAVVNGSLGMEYVIASAFPVRAGLFTDLSATPLPLQTHLDNGTHLDKLGATTSVGYQTEHVRTDVGLCATYGFGWATIPQNLDFTKEVATPTTGWAVYAFLATSYEF